MTTETTSTTEAGRALKAKHRAMWAFGDYPAVAAELAGLARRHDLAPGGTGNTVMEWEYLLLTARKRS